MAANPELAWLFYEHAVYSPEGYRGVFGSNTVYPNGLNTTLPSVKSALNPSSSLFKPLAGLGDQDLWTVGTEASLAIPAGYHIPSWFDQAATYLGANLQKLMDGQAGVSSADIWGQLMAACTFATVPTVVLFAFLQRHFIRGLLAGSSR